MKSIAYTLSILLLGATFAQADGPSAPAVPADKTTEAKVEAPAKSSDKVVVEEVAEEIEEEEPTKK
jgi:hypothetical protein